MYCCRVLPTVPVYHPGRQVVKHKYSDSDKSKIPAACHGHGDHSCPSLQIALRQAARRAPERSGGPQNPGHAARQPRSIQEQGRPRRRAAAIAVTRRPPDQHPGNAAGGAPRHTTGGGSWPSGHVRRRAGEGARTPPRQPGNDDSLAAAAAETAADARRRGAPLLRLPAFDMAQQQQPHQLIPGQQQGGGKLVQGFRFLWTKFRCDCDTGAGIVDPRPPSAVHIIHPLAPQPRRIPSVLSRFPPGSSGEVLVC